MTFNHYAKMKRILEDYSGWYVVRIDEPTTAISFSGERREFPYYYRVYDKAGLPIKFCKFQQIDRFASVLGVDVEDIPIVEVRSVPSRDR